MYESSCVIEVVWKDHNSCCPLYKYNTQFLKIYSKQNDVHRGAKFKSALCSEISQHMAVITYRRFGTTYRSLLQGSRMQGAEAEITQDRT